MKRWIGFPKVEGDSSRQAHARLPDGTYERELAQPALALATYHQALALDPGNLTILKGIETFEDAEKAVRETRDVLKGIFGK